MGFNWIPYRDYFYANPPLHLLLLKTSGALMGWGVWGLRLVPIGGALLGGFAAYKMFRGRVTGYALLPSLDLLVHLRCLAREHTCNRDQCRPRLHNVGAIFCAAKSSSRIRDVLVAGVVDQSVRVGGDSRTCCDSMAAWRTRRKLRI